MTKNFTLVLLSSLSFIAASAQEIKLVRNTASEITLNNAAPVFVSHSKNVNGTAYQDFSSASKVLTMEKGAPALPVHSESVIVPDSGNVSIVISYESFEEFDNVAVLPSKGSLKRNVNPNAIAYDFGTAYTQDAFYPGNLAAVSKPYILRDTRGVTVSFYPYQYNPVTKKLRLYRNITANVVVNQNEQGINEKTNTKATSTGLFNQVYQNHYINSEMYLPVAENGEMLVIAPDEYLEALSPLAEWKTKKGIRTTIAPLSETGDTPEDIKAYIRDFYNSNPGLIYILLAGDHDDLPTYTYGISGGGEELWSDTYYAQLEGNDFYPEALIGRFSGNVEEVSLMVNRTLEYEINPHEGNWITRAAGIGSNEGDGIGDDGEPDWQHMRNIATKLLENGYSYVHELYDGSHGENDEDGDVQPSMVANALNGGIGLLNYTGHGGQDVMVTGWYTINDAYGLENNGKYPFVVSVACNNGTFAGGTSLCEAMLRVQHNELPAGAIAAAGSSILMAWAEPMQTQDEMAELITGSEPGNEKYTLGGLFYNGQMSMLENYSDSDTAIEIMQTWVLFGDPSVVFRTNEATQIVATHQEVIEDSDATVTIQCAVEGARVAITQNGVIVGTGIVSGGQVVITLNGLSGELVPLSVTITQQNFIPYQGTIALAVLGTDGLSVNSVLIYPNPAHDHITIKMADASANAAFEVRDITGKLIYISPSVSGGTHTIDTSRYASGVYMLTVVDGSAKSTKKFIIR
ncbi:C25 family cysteine peptidase [Flavobacterium sp. DGU11]|uniref:C25 family cysteine peptidase n=1 Tax=Flavobacterium arundinis TaxID=3139143 RepID=A0ABU9HZ47_9FLAO